MRRPLTASAVLFASLLLTTGAASAQDFDAAGEQAMLARINAMRAAQGLAPLTRHSGLDAAARAHSSDMASQGALTHVSESSGTPADRVRAAGVTASTIAENVALHRTASEAHAALLGSDAHRSNMMSADVTHVGLAALRTERGVYVTQVFAAIAAPAPPPAVAAAPVEPAPVEPALVAPAPAAPVEPAPSEAPTDEPGPAVVAEQAPAAPPARLEGADCITPVPGVRLCGRLPAPSIQRVEPEARVEAAPPVAAPPAVAAPSAPAASLHVQPGSNGTVVIQRTADNARVEGYWVYGSGRWWYYPMHPGAQAGQRLQPDLSVSGPPPGFPAHPGGAPRAVPQPRAYRVAPPARVPAQPAQPHAQITIAPGTAFYAVPPPPMTGTPDRSWRRAHRQWMRAYRRWLRQQARLRRQAL